ncbi:MAG TPA: GHKL domain-containing protein [Gammaproteobacteria bacterium]|nr:GHKL domain-containing protein [Gammaproteobacteria bacterium]
MNSVQQRLQLGLIANIVLLMLLLWWLVAGAIEKFGEEFVQSRLEHDADRLLSALQVDESGVLQLTPDRMTNLYKQPFSGHYFVVLNDNKTLYSRSLWDESLAVSRLPKGVVRQWNTQGPLGQTLLVWAGGFQKQGQRFTLAVAEDLTPLSESLVRFNWYFAGLSLLTLMLLLGVQHYVVRRSFRPLEHILYEIKNLQQGAVGELSEDVPAEVRPLVREVNHLLRLLGERLQRSRNALGNLAHALKGPLSLLTRLGQQESMRALPDLSASLKQQTDNIRQLMDRELKRARLMGQGAPGVRFAPQEEMPVLVDVLQRMFTAVDGQKKSLDIHWQAPDVVFVFDRDDMLELIGNLLDNACKWAKHQVRCELRGDEYHLQLAVEDDGPGCSDEEIKQLTARGVRIDEAAPGHGLGLAIVRDVVEIYGGTLTLGRSSTLGGLRVSVCLEKHTAK